MCRQHTAASFGNSCQPILVLLSCFYVIACFLLTLFSEGNDGPWSTFDIRVGTPEQYIRVLVSTASPHTIVALSDSGCSNAVFKNPPPDCAVSRGNLFQPNKSSSWHNAGTYGINGHGVGLEANLGYIQRAQFGLERLGIGLSGPSLDNQTVAGIATANHFYLYACIASLRSCRLTLTLGQGNVRPQQPASQLHHAGKLLSAGFCCDAKVRE